MKDKLADQPTHVINLTFQAGVMCSIENLTTTTENYKTYNGAEYVIISKPTNYDSEKNYFNTRKVEAVIVYILF